MHKWGTSLQDRKRVLLAQPAKAASVELASQFKTIICRKVDYFNSLQMGLHYGCKHATSRTKGTSQNIPLFILY